MAKKSLQSAPRPFLTRLLETAGVRADQPALYHKHRGEWVVWHWRDVVSEIDWLAAGLKYLGLKAGKGVVVSGEITSRLFLVSAAIRSVGAGIISVPVASTTKELGSILDDGAIALVLSQGRDSLAEWTNARVGRRSIPIIFDHATPDSKSPGDAIIQVDRLRSLGTASHWPLQFKEKSGSSSQTINWAEETTDWREGLDILLDDWVNRGDAIALPELQAAATRDRAEISPSRWIASCARLEHVAQGTRERLPEPASIVGRLVKGSLEGHGAIWFRLVHTLLRKRLGLGRLKSINLFKPAHARLSHEAQKLFQAIGTPIIEGNWGDTPAKTVPSDYGAGRSYDNEFTTTVSAT